KRDEDRVVEIEQNRARQFHGRGFILTTQRPGNSRARCAPEAGAFFLFCCGRVAGERAEPLREVLRRRRSSADKARN
ncbi:MAG TPA: hypothetical protein VGF39_13370, partial [Stellaceae bacterium]